MLSKRRCPHTGVVNFYFDADPHIAVGSVIASDDQHFLWRCYTEPFVRSGIASDSKSAEGRVLDYCRRAAAAPASKRFSAA